MKLQAYEFIYKVNPKQKRARLSVANYGWTVRPKPSGAILLRIPLDRILRSDTENGVVIQKQKFTRILKQWD